MGERDDLVEIHDITVKRITDEALAHLQAGNIKEALLSLERAVVACESHPSFAQLEQSECQSVQKLISACDSLAVRTGGFGSQRVRGLLDRMQILKGSPLH